MLLLQWGCHLPIYQQTMFCHELLTSWLPSNRSLFDPLRVFFFHLATYVLLVGIWGLYDIE